MDFGWVVGALRRGLRVTRKAWAGDPPMYLYTSKTENGKRTVKMSTGTYRDFEWTPTAEQMLTVDDWEEYVDPKKAAQDKLPGEDLPVWPEVNADGYARMSKDSDAVVHDGVYRHKKEPSVKAVKDQIDYAKETRKIVADLPEDYYKVQLIDALVDAFVDKISQRVVRLLK